MIDGAFGIIRTIRLKPLESCCKTDILITGTKDIRSDSGVNLFWISGITSFTMVDEPLRKLFQWNYPTRFHCLVPDPEWKDLLDFHAYLNSDHRQLPFPATHFYASTPEAKYALFVRHH
jgi:hypothetical protein